MDQADTCEWLSSNGLGGYTSGTVCGANTRRYHGLLVAALEPPGRRVVLLSRIDETVRVDQQVAELGTSFWQSGATAPEGYRALERFSAVPIPTWDYAVGPARLTKRVGALSGHNATVVGY